MGLSVVNNVSGDLIGSGLDVENAALLLLYHDGSEFDILPDGDDDAPITLFVKSRNGSWRTTSAASTEEDLDAAKREIYAQVIATNGWVPSLEVMTDDEHAQMLADAED